MTFDDTVLTRCASNMAGLASRPRPMRERNAMFWMAQLFYMVDRDADLNHLVRASKSYKPKPSIVNDIRMRYGNDHLIREARHGL